MHESRNLFYLLLALAMSLASSGGAGRELSKPKNLSLPVHVGILPTLVAKD